MVNHRCHIHSDVDITCSDPRLGHGNTHSQAHPTIVSTLSSSKCIQVACGFAYTAAVTSLGTLYCWGAGENGRLGTGSHQDRVVPTAISALTNVPIAQVFAGSVHTCALSRSGDLYTWGKCDFTGHGLPHDILWPRLLTLNHVGQVSVSQLSIGPGGYHTLALTSAGEVYTWGHNRVGQLGLPLSQTFVATPERLEFSKARDDEIVTQVIAGWGHSALVTNEGQMYVCGRNEQGQLGLEGEFPTNARGHQYQSPFVANISLKNVVSVACGGEHTVATLEDSSVVCFGSSSNAGNRRMDSTPWNRRQVKDVSCGTNCTLMLVGKACPPTLEQRCIEFIQHTPEIYAYVCQAQDQLCIPDSMMEKIVLLVN